MDMLDIILFWITTFFSGFTFAVALASWMDKRALRRMPPPPPAQLYDWTEDFVWPDQKETRVPQKNPFD